MEKDPNVTPEEIMAYGTGSLRKAVKDGDEKMGSFMAGQSVGMVHKIQPAAEIIEEMMAQASVLLKTYCQWKGEL